MLALALARALALALRACSCRCSCGRCCCCCCCFLFLFLFFLSFSVPGSSGEQAQLIPMTISTWHRISAEEEFRYDYAPSAGDRRGYCVTSEVLLHGHESCGCSRRWQPEKVYWFLPHSDVSHGMYPLHYTRQENILAELRAQHPWTEIGFLVNLRSDVFYGELI